MSNKVIVFFVFAFILTASVPFFIARNLQLGSYAKSPQHVTIPLGGSALIAGGKAKLWFAGGDTGGDFEVRCASETRYFQPAIDEGCQACGVTVSLEKIEEGRPTRASFLVTWDSTH